MNQIDYTFLGGDPDVLDDMEFLQSSITEAIKGLASAWQSGGSDPVIISGLNTTVVGANTVYTDGYLIANSEVYFVVGNSFLTGSSLVIDIAETFDVNGTETFENLSVNQTWKVRRGVLKISTGSGTEIDLADTRTATQALISKYGMLTNQLTGWLDVGGAGVAFGSGWSNYAGANIARYRKNKIGEVEITGLVKNPTATGQVIFQLPSGLRPLTDRGFIVMTTDDLGTQFNQVVVGANGNITLFGTFGTNKTLYLNQIKFSID